VPFVRAADRMDGVSRAFSTMTEIAQLIESALRHNRNSLLRKAAMSTVARMPPATTLRELLASDAGDAIRELSLGDLAQALRDAGVEPQPDAARARRRAVAEAEPAQSPEERIYRRILDAIADEPLTIGQLAKRLDLEVEQLRGYLAWMKRMGKVSASGRARATRYQAVP
jgi:predicted Rossmann fold nucleotide-binding protein DprA/Smf involved in DNA uptake